MGLERDVGDLPLLLFNHPQGEHGALSLVSARHEVQLRQKVEGGLYSDHFSFRLRIK